MVQVADPAKPSPASPPVETVPAPRSRGGMDIMSLLNRDEPVPPRTRSNAEVDAASTASDATEEDKSAISRPEPWSAPPSGPYESPASASTLVDGRLPAWLMGPARPPPRDFSPAPRTIYDQFPDASRLSRPSSAMSVYSPQPTAVGDYQYRNSMPPVLSAPPPHLEAFSHGSARMLPAQYSGWAPPNQPGYQSVHPSTHPTREMSSAPYRQTSMGGGPLHHSLHGQAPSLSNLPPLESYNFSRDANQPHDGRNIGQ
jgi:hypothetical protein